MDFTKLDRSNRHTAKQAHRWGYYEISVLIPWGENVNLYRDKISFKDDTKCIILHTLYVP